jgi:hypothetical protein
MLVSRAVAMRSRTRTVGTLPPRSTAESMLRLTPARPAMVSSESPRPRRADRIRAPSSAMSSPVENRRMAAPLDTRMDHIPLWWRSQEAASNPTV